MSVIRSIDIGYGGVKFTVGVKGDEPICEIFPSIVGVGGQRPQGDVRPNDTVVTVVDGVRYECGRDGEIVVSKNEGRIEGADYATSPQYLALVNAALSYMGETKIDLLMLGLPISTFSSLKQTLKDAMTGRHEFYCVDPKTGEEELRTVDVKKVVVVRQPLGGLIDAATIDDSNFAGMESEDSLIVDVGHYTLDWVYAKGMNTVEKLCGASNGHGASAIYKVIQTRIQAQTGETVDVNKIEARYSSGAEGIKVNGKLVPFSQFDNDVNHVIKGALQNMLQKVDSTATIDNIVVVGGAAKSYAAVLKEMVKRDDILIPADPRFSNVRGFQIIGADLNAR